jgi:hypothetical protein
MTAKIAVFPELHPPPPPWLGPRRFPDEQFFRFQVNSPWRIKTSLCMLKKRNMRRREGNAAAAF